ncbi:hypothetical protein [Saccharicrinis aurantiacus]|uniref:hypothetical protein n=1 Tax=Saccharicrinis aurantiacus TaxID=1849719 RepID=UPI002491943A|nr:hypothetical protein [Saccharicrinis aurantiacus]
MGTWGTAISSNDTYEDIFSEFMDLYDDGLEPSEISSRIINQNSDLIGDFEDKNNFWFAMAMAQWQCKSLDPDLFNRVKTIIETGEDIKIWEELGADKKEINKRKKVLDTFLEKLSQEKDKPRKRKRKVLRDSIFQKGDCLTFRLDNDNFGGAFVLTSEKQTEYGMNMIAITTLNQIDKPTTDDFKKASVLIRKEEFGLKGYQDREMISWYYAQFFKKSKVNFEVIGNLKVHKDYKFDNDYTGASQWDAIKTNIEINEQINSERGKPDKKLKLSKLIKKHWL